MKHVTQIAGFFNYKGYWVSHCPIHPREISYKRGNIHGHLHAECLGTGRYINVSAENVNFCPVAFDEIENLAELQKSLGKVSKNGFETSLHE